MRSPSELCDAAEILRVAKSD